MMVAATPLFDRLGIAKASIESVLTLDSTVEMIGVTDGIIVPVYPDQCIDRYRYIVRDHGYLARNAINRLAEALETKADWIYLFDSDSLHLSSAIVGFETLKTKLKFREIGSLYISPVYRSLETVDINVDRTAGIGGISMLMRRDTAEYLYGLRDELLARASTGHYDWDNFFSKMTTTFRTRKSYLEHLGPFDGANGPGRRDRGIVERAINIDTRLLKSTLERFGLPLSHLS